MNDLHSIFHYNTYQKFNTNTDLFCHVLTFFFFFCDTVCISGTLN